MSICLIFIKAKERGIEYIYVVADGNVFKQYYINTIFKLITMEGIDRKMFQDFNKCQEAMFSAINGLKANNPAA